MDETNQIQLNVISTEAKLEDKKLENWRWCKTCMDREWFILISGKWICKVCGRAYLE